MATMNIMDSHVETFRLDFTDMEERSDWLDEIYEDYMSGRIFKAWCGMEVRYGDQVWNTHDQAAVYIVCETDYFHELASRMNKNFGYTVNEYR